MPVAGPAVIGGASIIGSMLARNSAKGSSTPSGTEANAISQQTALGTQQAGFTGQAGGYFSKLAGGNRATMTQALAPEIQDINQVYGGTARTLSRFLRGPTRDTQMAEGERQRAGAIGSLFSGARPQANAQLASMGSGAPGIFGAQAQQGMSNRYAGAQLQEQAGNDFGGLLFNLLKTYSGGKSGSSSSQFNPGQLSAFPA